jgi:hypothetical protein
MNLEETKIYHPKTLKEYSLYEADGQELLRQLLKSYSLYGGAKKKPKGSKKAQPKENKRPKETNIEDTSCDSSGELFFNKRLPKDYAHSDLTSEIKDFMNVYKNKPRPELMKYLSGDSTNKYVVSSELLSVYKKDELEGPSIEASHVYNPCMPIRWRDDFLPTEKLIKAFFNKHSNSDDIHNEMKNILKEEVRHEEEVDEPENKQNAEEMLNRLFIVSPPSPFYRLTMEQLANSVLEIIQEIIAAFAILKTPTFNMDNEFDQQMTLHYLNYYGEKMYTPILDVYNHIKLAINDAVKEMTKTYKKQNLTEDNIDEHLKVIVVGNTKNYNKIMEKIMRYRKFIANKKKDALETSESGRYEEPIPYYACIKVDILGDVMFTMSGDEGLLYLNEDGEIKQSIQGIMKQTPDKLVSFYAKQKRKAKDASVYITDPRSSLDDYYDISLELYIYKLLVNEKIKSGR